MFGLLDEPGHVGLLELDDSALAQTHVLVVGVDPGVDDGHDRPFALVLVSRPHGLHVGHGIGVGLQGVEDLLHGHGLDAWHLTHAGQVLHLDLGGETVDHVTVAFPGSLTGDGLDGLLHSGLGGDHLVRRLFDLGRTGIVGLDAAVGGGRGGGHPHDDVHVGVLLLDFAQLGIIDLPGGQLGPDGLGGGIVLPVDGGLDRLVGGHLPEQLFPTGLG